MKTYIWYDYETFGTDTRRDRISQFAAVRTDEDFNIIKKTEYFCKQSEEYIPNYEACLVTKITPQIANRKGISEEKLANEIYREFTKPDTVSIGYNSIKFDDEVTRNLFYRTFRDPYTREWKDGCSRWDFMRAVLAFYLEDNSCIHWARDNQGKPSFKLERLTEANGIEHIAAHDAMSDVIATIDFAKLLHNLNKELYQYVFSLREKSFVNKLLSNGQVFIHGDFSYSYERNYSSILYKVNVVKRGTNDVIFLDLNSSLEIFKELSIEELRDLYYMKSEELEKVGRERPGIKLIRVNQSPLLFTWDSYKSKDSIDIEHIKRQVDLAREIEMRYAYKLAKIFDYKENEGLIDPELDIYGGFPSPIDKNQFNFIHRDPKNYKPSFEDKKYEELYFRWRARNYRELLTQEEEYTWNRYCYDLLTGIKKRDGYLDIKEFQEKILDAREVYKGKVEELEIIDKLEKYVDKLIKDLKKNIGVNGKKSIAKVGKMENLKLF